MCGKLQPRSHQTLLDLAWVYDPPIRGRVNLLRRVPEVGTVARAPSNRSEAHVVGSVFKYKRLRSHKCGAAHYVRRVARQDPDRLSD